MCGIAGIVGPGAEQEMSVARRMLAMLAHRGPDDEGLWSSDDVVFGHRRLSILDLSPAGHQPMHYANGRFTITFNGEIYNYQELRQELSSHGALFQSQTDTEVILAAWERWGERCVEKFNGMWSFALWDAERRILFASRDRFGKKPFYYCELKGRMYFASEIKALLSIPRLNRTLNFPALADFCLERVLCDSEETLIHEVKPLSPATSLVWHDGHFVRRTYWMFPSDTPPVSSQNVSNLIAPLLEDSVRLRMRADTPVGCLLSGGLDSSTIASLMRRETGERPVHLFTTRTQPPVEEIRGVERMLEGGGYIAHWHTPDARLFWKDLPELIWHQESPFADGSMAAHFALMREAQRSKIPVLLSGQGADEVFAGYPTFLWRWLGSLLRHGNWREARRSFQSVGSIQPVRYGAVALHALPRSLRRLLRSAHAGSSDWLSDEVRAAGRSIDRWEDAATVNAEVNAAQRSALQRWTLPGFLQYEDRNAMAFGIETRLPYLDYRLVEAVWALPAQIRFDGGWTKALLRQAAQPWLPESIVRRPAKEGYPAPLANWLQTLEPELLEVAQSDVVKTCPVLNPQVWTRRLHKYLKGDHSELEPVWRGLVCALWYRRFFVGALP